MLLRLEVNDIISESLKYNIINLYLILIKNFISLFNKYLFKYK